MNTAATARQLKTLAAACALLCAAGTATAASFSLVGHNRVVNGSMWGPGSGFVYDYSSFQGVEWGQYSGKVGGIAHTIAGSYGAELGATLHAGMIGLDLGARIDGGSWSGSGAIGMSGYVFDSINANSSGSKGSLAYRSSTDWRKMGDLSTQSPIVQAHADLRLKLRADAGATVCVVGCVGGGGNLLNVDSSYELLSINRDNNGQLRFLGQTLANGDVDMDIKVGGVTLGHLSAGIPNIVTAGEGFGLVRSSGQDQVANVSFNLSNILSTSLGMPLSGNAGIVGYSLIDAYAGLDMNLHQEFGFSTSAVMSLKVLETGQSFSAGLGEGGSFGVDLQGMPSVLTVVPTVQFVGRFSNRTFLSFDPFFEITAGAISADALGYSASLGPMFHERIDLPGWDVDVYNTSFDIDFGSTELAAMQIRVCYEMCLSESGPGSTPDPLQTGQFGFGSGAPANPYLSQGGDIIGSISGPPIPAVPEPESYALMLAGLGLLALQRRRRRH